MSEQKIHLGEQDIALKPENPALTGLIRLSEARQAEQLAEQVRSRQALDDFPSIPGMDDFNLTIRARFEIPAMAPEAKHAMIWEEMDDPEGKEALQRLEGQTVLDLGSGKTMAMLQEFIKEQGASRYIGVDSRALFGPREVEMVEGFGRLGHLSPEANDTLLGVLIRGDLLRVASRLPDDSMSIALNGIDDFIVKADSPYGQRLQAEIIRILHPDGLIFGVQNQSGMLNELIKAKGLHGFSLPIPNRPNLRDHAGFYFIHK